MTWWPFQQKWWNVSSMLNRMISGTNPNDWLLLDLWFLGHTRLKYSRMCWIVKAEALADLYILINHATSAALAPERLQTLRTMEAGHDVWTLERWHDDGSNGIGILSRAGLTWMRLPAHDKIRSRSTFSRLLTTIPPIGKCEPQAFNFLHQRCSER